MDRVTPEVRSRIMAKVRSRGNRSTEAKLRASLVGAGVTGWRLHARDVPGTPDFAFDDARVAVFVDGCFWHGCPRCYRRPASSQAYWDEKVKRNMARDRRNRAALRRAGWIAVPVWEHSLKEPAKVRARIQAAIAKRG